MLFPCLRSSRPSLHLADLAVSLAALICHLSSSRKLSVAFLTSSMYLSCCLMSTRGIVWFMSWSPYDCKLPEGGMNTICWLFGQHRAWHRVGAQETLVEGTDVRGLGLDHTLLLPAWASCLQLSHSLVGSPEGN